MKTSSSQAFRGFRQFFERQPLDQKNLQIHGVGVREKMPPPSFNERPRGTGDFLLMLFHDPAFVARAKNERTLHPPETMMIWMPGEPQYYGNATRSYSHTWIHCDGLKIRSMLRELDLPVSKPFTLPSPYFFEKSLLEIHGEMVSHLKPDPVIITNLLENTLRQMARVLKPLSRQNSFPEKLLEVRKWMMASPAKPLTLQEMAKFSGISLPYFCAQFKNAFGTSPMECLIQHRMHHAARLLANRNLRVSEIAVQVGYEDLFHFSKMFKKRFGVSPRGYRDQI